MPFTLAHPAAALLLRRTRLPALALVVGCMAPDLEYFVRMHAGGGFGHTLPGLLLMDLPMGLAALWLYQTLLREPLTALLPRALRERVAPPPSRVAAWMAERLGAILVAIVAGALTHLAWDSFTHRKTWLFHHWSGLNYPVPMPVVGTLRLFHLLQHLSTLVGLAVLALWIAGWMKRTAPLEANAHNAFLVRYRSWMACSLTGFAVTGACVFVGKGIWQYPEVFSENLIVVESVISLMSFFAAGLAVWGIAGRWARKA